LFIPFASSSFYLSAYIGCWWDLRRDPFTFIFALYLSLVYSGVCVVFGLLIDGEGTVSDDDLNGSRSVCGVFLI
jgi:hypothetical protein